MYPMDKIKFTELSVSDKIAMLNLTFSLHQAGLIDISDRYKGTPEWILNALVEEAINLLEKNELVSLSTD